MKENCQIFTPKDQVIEMLDIAGYKKNIVGKKILENACGSGNVLKVVVKRYIEEAISNEFDLLEIKRGLERDILAYEIDDKQKSKCINRLDSVAMEYGIYDVKWSIYDKDFLKENISTKFDFIISNPPYINYKDLDIENRQFIKRSFISCAHGKPDYCYPFIEKSYNLLEEEGILVYLVPISIFKNVFARELREIIKLDLVSIIDYSTIKIFKGVTTSSSIFKIIKGSKKKVIKYKKVSNNDEFLLEKTSLGDIWEFKQREEIKSKNVFKLKDFYIGQNTIATLKNDIFIIRDYIEEKEYIRFNSYMIEKEVLRKAASPKGIKNNKKEYIIFPYYYDKNNILNRYSEKQFASVFPLAYKYLLDKKHILCKRKSDKNSQWFEYGRTQALSKLNQRKLLISKVVTRFPKAYILDKNTIPYSGIIVFENSEKTLEYLKNIIETHGFNEYINVLGTNVNGNSIQISPKILLGYEIYK